MSPPISRLPAEISSMVMKHLPREDLFSARFVNKSFAAYAAQCLFEVIPVWINVKSLGTLTSLSHCSHLRGHVKHVVMSAFCFLEPWDETVYFKKVRTYIREATDDPSIQSLRFEQYKLAYYASIRGQRYLRKGGLDRDLLTKAFRCFVHLQRITYDRSNSNIGFSQVINDFGINDFGINDLGINGFDGLFKQDLITFDDLHTLPTLLRAMSESETRVTDLSIGCEYNISKPRYHSAADSMPSRLTAAVLIAVFSHPAMLVHSQQVMSQVRTLKIEETNVRDSRQDLLGIAAMIKQMTAFSPELTSVEIGEFCSTNPLSRVQLLSIENIFELQSAYHLQHVVLTHLEIPDHQNIVSFLRHHACTLVHAELVFIELLDERWSTVLDQLRACKFPALQWFNTRYCHDWESSALKDDDAVDEMRVHQFLLHQRDRNPRVLPYIYA